MPRLIMSSAWMKEAEPAVAAFADWARRFQTATPEQRSALLAEGMALATERRKVLAEWIRTDPERALAAAVPVMVRRGLPQEILSLLETRISGMGELALIGVTPKPGSTEMPDEAVYRTALVNGQEFRAHTYGRRDTLNTVPQASLNGIALDGQMAVSDSPVRVLETGETADGRNVTQVCPVSGIVTEVAPDAPLNVDVAAVTAIEVNGKVEVLCEPEHVLQRESALAAAEGGTRERVLAGNNLPGTSGVVNRPALAWTHGTKKVLIIRVQFPDKMGTPLNESESNDPITEAHAVNRFNAADGVRDFYAQGSFGKTTLSIAGVDGGGDSPDVTPVLTMPSTASYYALGDGTPKSHYSSQLHSDARAAAATAGVAVDTYDRIGVVFSDLSDISGSKITYGGLGTIEGKSFWINGSYAFSVVAHEIGHNYGLQHSSLWEVTDGNPISATGTSHEYKDIFDVMGDGSAFENDFSHWNKSILQWIPDSGVTGITSGGTYRVHRFDHPSANLANKLALKIVRNRQQDYWIGLRRGTSNASMDGGAYVLWGYNDNAQGNLLDLTSPVNETANAALAVGATFTDSVAGITLHPVAQGGSGADEWLDLQVTLQPRLSWALDEFIVDEQVGTATLTVTRESNSTGSVSVGYATSAGTATAGPDYTTSSGTLTWPSGDMTPKTLTIPVVADAAVEGTENFTVTLSGATGGAVIINNPAATVTIADPGARDRTFTPEFTNSTVNKVLPLPDGSALIGGVFATIQDTAFNVYARGGITRIRENGTFDTAFAEEGGYGTFDGLRSVKDMARQPDGKIIVGGHFTTFNGQSRSHLVRLNADGTLDTTFNAGTGPDAAVYSILLLPGGKIVIGGAFTSINGTSIRMLARLNADGSLDGTFTPLSFGAGGGWHVDCLALQTDGKIVVGGTFYFGSGGQRIGLCRANSDGTLDTTFNGVVEGGHTAGNTGEWQFINDVKVEMDGRILIAGDFTAFNNTPRGGFARLTTTGALDPGINPTSNGTCNAILVQPDGRILVGGSFTTFNGVTSNRLARLSSAGTVETGFSAAGGGSQGTIRNFALQADGKVLLCGSSMQFQGSGSNRGYHRFFGGLPGLPGTVQLASETAAGIEGTNATLSVTRTGGSSGVLLVGYSTVSGTAGGSDFTTTTGTLTWADGDATAKTISVPIANDGTAEAAESFVVNLGQPLRNSTLLGSLQRATVNVTTAFDSWRGSYFTTLELASSSISGDVADPDGDGLSNLLEFGLNLNPVAPNNGAAQTAAVQNVGGSNYLTLTFKRRTPALDLTYGVQTNPGTLNAGDWLGNAVLVGTPTDNGDGTETVTFRDTTAISGAIRRFMRVQVVRSP
ncbi:MAG: Calx-beta domain-containing protein [Prosthecobacter sp.]